MAFVATDLGGAWRERKHVFPACTVCPNPAPRLCDFRLADGRTCNKPLCSSHAVSVAPGVDHCHGHPMPLNPLAYAP